jgi:prepilin-type N-terminal cleavage/methylation domain-containing protein/prepilin-type processing-associated H-X9-DG protein
MTHPSHRGFSIVELLVVIGIITILIGIILPVVVIARRRGRDVHCASNLRQLTTAMTMYATEFNGWYPPNVGLQKMFWYNNAAIGRALSTQSKEHVAVSDGVDQQYGGVFVCPNSLPGTVRSYSMNTFASSVVSSGVQAGVDATPPRGKLFKSGAKESSHLILLIEAFAVEDWPAENPNPTGYAAPALVGFSPVPIAKRFGSRGAVFLKDVPRYGSIAAQICYFRHRRPRQAAGGLGDAIGRLNIGFADGHVAMCTQDDLIDKSTGKSTYEAMWSPVDREIE